MITIREADPADGDLCADIRPVYTTRAAWQFVLDGDPLRSVEPPQATSGLPALAFHLQQTRLPRQLALRLPSAFVPLPNVWPHYAARLVACDEEEVVCGYLVLHVLPDQQQATIDRFLVDITRRRKGTGNILLRAARSWVRAQGLLALRAHAPLRNVPGIEFYQRRGFRICGLSERFYPTQEDALLLMHAC